LSNHYHNTQWTGHEHLGAEYRDLCLHWVDQ
jgi:hypothetical protein